MHFPTTYDVLCLSHLRWNFVYQRPQHLLSRCARNRRVFFAEEPIFHDGASRLSVTQQDGVTVLLPELNIAYQHEGRDDIQAALLGNFCDSHNLSRYLLWYYTPMALPVARHLRPVATVYDCMDELSGFKNAPTELRQRERQLMNEADVVFCGGKTLYEAKQTQHHNIHLFPSSVDTQHFGAARTLQQVPPDLACIPSPRLGFFGVIDERMDLSLLAAVAEQRPNWQIVMLGPVTKISDDDLPRRSNIHYLGAKSYAELPQYLAGWDVALLPFARNDATRFISPTKTPEYLAAGKPVVSTSIRDVVFPYGELGLVHIADAADDFVTACEAALTLPLGPLLQKADRFLARGSWDKTWRSMERLLNAAVARNARTKASTYAGVGRSNFTIDGVASDGVTLDADTGACAE